MAYARHEKLKNDNVCAERVIMKMINTLYDIHPSLANKLAKNQAYQILDTIVTSHMVGNGYFNPRDRSEDRKEYGRQMITYDREVREIADSLNLDQTIVVEFVRGCFEINGANGIYPSMWLGRSSFWSSYSKLLKLTSFSNSIMKTIAGYAIGKLDGAKVNSEFKIFARVTRALSVLPPWTRFIIEACNYVSSKYSTVNTVPGQSIKIFVDEFVDCIREFDEEQYLVYEKEIGTFLERINDSFTPDCSAVLCTFELNKLDSYILKIRNGFKWFPTESSRKQLRLLAPLPTPKTEMPDDLELPSPSISDPLLLPRVATVAKLLTKADFEDDSNNSNEDEE